MFARFTIASISFLLAIPLVHNGASDSSVQVKVGDLLTVKLNDQIGFVYRTECGITPEPTFPSGRTQKTVDGVRTYSKFVTETSGSVITVADDQFTVRCLTTVEDHEDGPRIVSITSTFTTGDLQTTTIPNPKPLFGGMSQAKPRVTRHVEVGSTESAKLEVWKLTKTFPEKKNDG